MINNMHRLRTLFAQVSKRVRGFTLIETLVAVLLLVASIAGPLTLAAKGLSAAQVSRDQMIAFFLAQDAVEYVHYVRDSNKLAGTSWLAGSGAPETDLTRCVGGVGCTIDPFASQATQKIVPCLGTCDPIKKKTNGTSVYFTYDSTGVQTPQQFRRTVTLTPPPGAMSITNEAVLTVAVSWRAQSGVTRTISIRESIFDWQ